MASCKSQPNLRRPQLLAEEEEDKSRSRTVGRLLGRLSHPSNRAKKIRQILAGRDMGHEEEIEERTNQRTVGRISLSSPPLSLSLVSLLDRRCQFSSWYLTLSDAFLVHRAVSPSSCPRPQSIRCDITLSARAVGRTAARAAGRQNVLPNQPPVPLRANKYRRGGESY